MTTKEDDSVKVILLTEFHMINLLFKTNFLIFQVNIKEIIDTIRICSICLGDASDDLNELIDCDECGITVHESKYLLLK